MGASHIGKTEDRVEGLKGVELRHAVCPPAHGCDWFDAGKDGNHVQGLGEAD